MLKPDDTDIDALMGSVVGGNGQVIEFPPAKERVERKRTIKAKKRPSLVEEFFGNGEPEAAAKGRAKVDELSGELAAEIETNDAKPVIDPRTVPVRFSNLKHMARSALHYHDAVQLGREDTLAMRLGRGAHAMVLGEPVVKWKGKKPNSPRNGKDWDKFKADHPGAEILNAKEWAIAEGIANAIRRHPIAAPILFGDDAILEQTIEWEWLGRKCTSRPDSRKGSAIVADLKTTQCAEPNKFKRDAMWRAYNAQLAFYGLAVEHATGVRPEKLYVVAVESKRPYAVQVLELDEGARLQGEKLCRQWFEALLVAEASDSWPAYTDAIVKFDIPSDGDPNDAIDLDELDDDDPLFA